MEHERVEIRSRAELRQWLTANHEGTASIWLVTWKKHTDFYVSWDEVVEEALCFGWIDSQPRKLDGDRSMLRLSPRKPGSAWSGVNKTRIRTLLANGLMNPAGLATIEHAKRPGTRATRIEATARMAALGQRANQWSKRQSDKG